ncbi:MAG: hypothetical protein ACKOCT_14815, partial [Alphaproteobacteria bacterium]
MGVPTGRWAAALALALGALGACATVARAVDLRFQPSLLGQVRRSPWSAQTQVPTELYGDLGLSDLPFGSTFDTFFRLE